MTVTVRSGISDGALQYANQDMITVSSGNVYIPASGNLNVAGTVNSSSGSFSGSLTLNGNAVVTSASGLGINQTWQDVHLSRAMNVGYVNTTGRPIVVSASGGVAAYTTAWQVIVNAGFGNVVASNATLNPNDASATIQAIIPAGHTYYLTGGGAIAYWAELR